MKLTATKGELALNTQPDRRLTHLRREWYRKWNRIGALITCILIFLLLLAIVFESMWHDSIKEDNLYAINQFENIFKDPQCATKLIEDNKKCQIFCEYLDEVQFLNNFLQDISNIMNCQSVRYLSLSIQNSNLDNLYTEWLQIPSGYILKELQFGFYSAETYINTIEENAFSGPVFQHTETITFTNAGISLIKKYAFNTPNLIDLNFRESLVEIIEENFAKSMNRLQILEMVFTQDTTKNSERLLNITKSMNYPNLLTLDLRFTHWDFLSQSMFKSMKNLQALYATSAQIDYIERNTFRNNKQLRKIFLDNAGLTFLPNDIFGFPIKPIVELNLQENDWYCNCSLQWLKEAWLSSKRIEEPKCAGPPVNEGKTFRDADFCSIGNITTISTYAMPDITSSFITITTPRFRPSHTIKIKLNCLNGGKITISQGKRSKMKPLVNFQIQEISPGDVQITIKNFIESYSVLWTNNIRDLDVNEEITCDRTNQTGCLTNIDRNPIISRLLPSNSYVICLVHRLETLISPFSCKAITTRAVYEEQAWIKNKYKMFFGIGSGITLTLLLTFGITIGIFIHRNKPINIEHNYQMDSVRPSQINIVKDNGELSLTNVQDGSEISHRDNIYEEIDRSEFTYEIKHNGVKPHYIRSFSDGTINNYSTFTSSCYGYTVPRVPTQFELLSWKMECMKEKRRSQGKPPPLPPHP